MNLPNQVVTITMVVAMICGAGMLVLQSFLLLGYWLYRIRCVRLKRIHSLRDVAKLFQTAQISDSYLCGLLGLSGMEIPDRGLSEKEQLFQGFYKKYYVKVFMVAWNIVDDFDEAADIVQETFCRTWQHMNDLDCVEEECFCTGKRQPIGWLVQTARRLSWASAKRQSREYLPLTPVLRLDDILSFCAWHDDASRLLKEERLSELAHYVASLPCSYRDVVQHHYMNGQSCKRIAERLGMPVGTVTSMLTRARAMLYERIMADELEPIA